MIGVHTITFESEDYGPVDVVYMVGPDASDDMIAVDNESETVSEWSVDDAETLANNLLEMISWSKLQPSRDRIEEYRLKEYGSGG